MLVLHPQNRTQKFIFWDINLKFGTKLVQMIGLDFLEDLVENMFCKIAILNNIFIFDIFIYLNFYNIFYMYFYNSFLLWQ